MQGLIDFFISQFQKVFEWLGNTIGDICGWFMSAILWILSSLGQVFSFTAGKLFLFYKDCMMDFLAYCLGFMPQFGQMGSISNDLYVNFNMIMPVDEAFGCAIVLFHLWLACWTIKIILKLVPTIY